MLKIKNAVKKYRCVPVATGVASVAMAFPAFAEGLLRLRALTAC